MPRIDRDVLAPACVLFWVMAAHALLETARDALFLAHLGPDRLASAYLAIAAIALIAVVGMRRWGVRDPRRMLIRFLVGAVIGTSALAAIAPTGVFALYVWTGIIATLVVPCFWTVIDRSMRVGQAKRVFAAIGAGGVFGALVGSALASLLGRVLDPRHLVTAGALGFGVATVTAIVLAPRPLADVTPPRVVAQAPAPRRGRRYIVLLLLVGMVSTITLTIGDLTFKRVLGERVAPHNLATVFGAVYTGLNVIGLAIQLAVTPRVLAKIGVGGALLVLPVIMVSTSLGFAITGGWIAIMALKLGDGGLRHSLYRVTHEILFLAVPAPVRDAAKPVIDAVAQRGGQAAAALLVFAAGAFGAGAQLLAGVTAIAAVTWLVAIGLVRGAYIAQFRDVLDEAPRERAREVASGVAIGASSVAIDERAVRAHACDKVAAAARFATFADALADRPQTPDLQLLRRFLVEQQQAAVAHVFRALDVLAPHAGMRSIHAGLTSHDDARRGAAREVFEHLAAAELRVPLLAVIDDLTPERRRAKLGALAPGPFATYEALLAALLVEPHAILRCLVAHHIADSELAQLRPVLARLRPREPFVRYAIDYAIARLDHARTRARSPQRLRLAHGPRDRGWRAS